MLSDSQPYDSSDPRKKHRKKVEAIDHFLERYQTESIMTEAKSTPKLKSIMIKQTDYVYDSASGDSSPEAEPMTVYWPLKKDISPEQKPHDLDTSLSAEMQEP